MSPAASTTTTPATTILPGHVGNLTIKETEMLKQLWERLFTLFTQKGVEFVPAAKEEAPKKGGWFSKKEVTTQKDYFIGATTDPQWLNLPLEKAIVLIPGHLLRESFWNMAATDNPDSVLLRFLRARKWDLNAAYNMLINTLRWRIVMRMDELIALGENGLRDELNRLNPGLGDSFITNLYSGKAFLGGPDREGRPICFINVNKHYKEDQSPEVIRLLTMYIMESSRVFVHQPLETCCIVFNMDGFTLKNMDFDFVKFLVSCFEAYYPETLGLMCIHIAPWVFSTVWAIIHPLLDPVVAQKIQFTKSLDDIIKHIDRSALPGNITGEANKKTLDEAVKVAPVVPGTLTKPSGPKYTSHLEVIKEYEAETAEWVKAPTNEDGNDAARRALALQYRKSRIASESETRGPTSYQAKGIFTYTPEDHLIINFGSEGWVPLDITDAA